MKPVTANISHAIVIRAINTLAPARATREVPALLVVANTLNATANHLILGHQALVNARQLINTLAAVPDTLEVLALLAAVSIPPAPVPAAMNGKMGLVVFPDPFVILVLYIIVIILVHQIKLAVKLCLE